MTGGDPTRGAVNGSGMNIKKSVVDSVAVIALAGDLDAGSADVVHADVTSIMPAHSRILLDLSETVHVTAAGLRTLLLLYRQGRSLDSAVAVVGLSPELRNILAATGFLAYFHVADSVGDGIELLTADARGRETVDA